MPFINQKKRAPIGISNELAIPQTLCLVTIKLNFLFKG